MMRRIAILAVAAVLVLAIGPVTRAAPAERVVEDDLVALTLDAEGDDFDVLRAFLSSRGPAATAALRRAATTEEPQRAWLADALAGLDGWYPSTWPRYADRGAPAGVPQRPPPPDSAEPSDPPPPPADVASWYDDAEAVVVALKGRRVLPETTDAEPDPFGSSLGARGASPPLDRDARCKAILHLAASALAPRSVPPDGSTPPLAPAVDPQRVLPWIEHLTDDAGLAAPWRIEASTFLPRFRTTDAAARILRVIDELRNTGHDLREAVPALAATGAPDAARFLMRLEAQRVRVRDGSDYEAAGKALHTMRRDAPAAVAAAEADTLVLFRRYEAEAAPMRHSTGVAVEGGWAVRRGRDGAQHAIYGPYVDDLPTRRFTARVRFRIDALRDHDGDEDVLWFDAMSIEYERHGHRAATKAIRRSEARLGEWQEADLGFWPDPKPSKMEFRTYWDGRCDAVIDRIDLLEVRPDAPDERAAFPPRTPSPWTARPAPVRLLPETAALLFDEMTRRRGARYRGLRDALLSDPVAAKAVLDAAAAAKDGSDRAWLADVLRTRLASRDEFTRLRAAHDAAMSRLEGTRTVPGWMNHEPSPYYAFFRRDLETGRCAIRIDGAPRTAEDVSLVGAEPPSEHTSQNWFRRSVEGVIRPLPSSPLWPAVLAEVWLTDALPPPLPRSVDRTKAPAPGTEEVLDVAGFSSVGHRRLHALQRLAWLGEKRIRPALLRLRDDANAAVSERAVAARRLKDLGE